MTMQQLLELAESCGFDHVGELNVSAMEFSPAVRQMCAADRCRNYGRCWTCPPYCGELEQISARAKQFHRGILIQSTGKMEDDFDVETIEQTQQRQQRRFMLLMEKLRESCPGCLPMGAGGCSICETCTCPDGPCRFPHKAIASMEAYGLLVSKVCEDSGLEYYYGPQTITFTSCVLVD